MLPDTLTLKRAGTTTDHVFTRTKHASAGQRASWQGTAQIIAGTFDKIEVAQEVTKAGRTNTLLSITSPAWTLDSMGMSIRNPNGDAVVQLKISVPKGTADASNWDNPIGILRSYLIGAADNTPSPTANARVHALLTGEH